MASRKFQAAADIARASGPVNRDGSEEGQGGACAFENLPRADNERSLKQLRQEKSWQSHGRRIPDS